MWPGRRRPAREGVSRAGVSNVLAPPFPKSGRYVDPHHPYCHLAQSGGRRVVQRSFGSLTFKGPPLPARSAISRPILVMLCGGIFSVLWVGEGLRYSASELSRSIHVEASRYVRSAWELSRSLRFSGLFFWWCSRPAYVGRESLSVRSRSFFRLRLLAFGDCLTFS